MAKRKAGATARPARKGRSRSTGRRSAKTPSARKQASKRPKKSPAARAKASSPARRRKAPTRKAPTRKAPTRRAAAEKAPTRKAVAKARPAVPAKVPRLDRARRTLDDEVVPTPPSSLNMDRHGSAARTGRAEYADNLRKHRGMNDVSAGDVDVNVEDAFFTGEEAPGGDNPTPDQDVVDDIGKALGVEYADNEELKAADKVGKRDKHRWELDPASSEDYKDRD